jgi:hypothetical protein
MALDNLRKLDLYYNCSWYICSENSLLTQFDTKILYAENDTDFVSAYV